MSKTREDKRAVLEALEDRLMRAKSLVFADFRGLNVKDTTDLRKQCRENGVDYLVVKKTLLQKALEKTGYHFNPREIEGELAISFSYEDEVAAAKLLSQFGKTHEALKITGAVLERKLLNAGEARALALLPGKKDLLGTLCGTLQAPISGFVNVLAGTLRSFVQVVNAIKESKA